MSSLVFLLAFVASADARAASAAETTISIVGTSDLHGHIAALPWFSGYLRNLRAARAPGAVVVLDAGDMFQGTLESNLAEGAPVIEAYNALGYSAAAIGNHEFDFGPVGPEPSPVKPGDDPQGALKARAAQAHFPFLAANIADRATHKPVVWRNVLPSTLIDAGGIKVGIIGAVTAATARSTFPANIAGLDFLPLAPAIAAESRRLRRRGAKLVILVAHEGGACRSFADANALGSCDARGEIFSVAEELPKGTVDAIVAGHTHQGVAHRVAGIPIIESFANGRAFGRIDLTVDRATGSVLASHLEAPHDICPSGSPEACKPDLYLDRPVEKDAELADLLAPAFEAARRKGEERLGVEVGSPMPYDRARETALGNLIADLMRASQPDADVAMINGGGMRAGLSQGPLTYRRLYEAFPFDNAFSTMKLGAGELRRLLSQSLGRSQSLVSLSGIRVRARCQGQKLDVVLSRADGTPLSDDTTLTLATTDYLATGGDGFFREVTIPFKVGAPVRDELAKALRKRGGHLLPDDPVLFDPAHPRFDLPGPVPIRCP
jgi:2',3'-cyclic-nucleotide 2'-phosphodiesterase (5'-nucleotidase family)